MAKRLGIVGGGQLGRMLALAAAPLGVECRFIDPSPDAGARVAADQLVAAYDDRDALAELAAWSDVITFEFENVPAEALAAVAGQAHFAPSPRSLEVSQDRLLEKQLFAELGLGVAPYVAIDSAAELAAAIDRFAGPAILKTRRLGYDGKGQVRIESSGQATRAWDAISAAPAIVEQMVEFRRELSVVVARDAGGRCVVYPPSENVHRDGILFSSSAPAVLDERELAAATSSAIAIAERLDHVGVLTVELFDLGDALAINELAPRVHNSGHWTQNGCLTSQFENHVRAVVGLPLGDPRPVRQSVMINFVGGMPDPSELLAIPGTALHLYDKSARPGRKLAHANVVELERDDSTFKERVQQVAELADAAWISGSAGATQ